LCGQAQEHREEQSENYFHDAGFRDISVDPIMLPTKLFLRIRVSIGTFEKLEGILVSVIKKAIESLQWVF
jgi:hypothetical protein